ncbi:unnamed protein product, partial [Mesorhabditis belari]|uniref:Peptidyl-prolyl cis-trans isomerase n=1 Tax=Mesorhabditis belari TaxID=2138241 RepID=A0AAF3FC19_9BILA
MAVLIETSLGDLIVDLFVKERPNCCRNFLKLCKMKYYNLCQFHHIEQNYIAQTGDPTGTGRGGESFFTSIYGEQARFFEKEEVPKLRHTRQGVVSFVNNGNDMLGSQFYVTLGDDLDYLDDQHTIFGQVTEGLETLEKLNEQLCNEEHRPFRDIRISHTIVLDDPFEDPVQIKFPSRSPSPTLERLISANQIAIDENLNDMDGMTEEEIKKELEEREMRAQAQILEIVGDLRSAEDIPPENVLFVCKLNPVTTDEDLEIIFSRFGKIECCEIIRDRRTGASLQYAFIEFAEPKSVEAAYFKMDNVLIDDRRIHVDFSQSVSKNFKWSRMKQGSPERATKKPLERSQQPRKTEQHHRDERGSARERNNGREFSHRRRSRTPEREKRRERDRNGRDYEKRKERHVETGGGRWGDEKRIEVKREVSSSPERRHRDKRPRSPVHKKHRRESPVRNIKKEAASSDSEHEKRHSKKKRKERKRSSDSDKSPVRERRRR